MGKFNIQLIIWQFFLLNGTYYYYLLIKLENFNFDFSCND